MVAITVVPIRRPEVGMNRFRRRVWGHEIARSRDPARRHVGVRPVDQWQVAGRQLRRQILPPTGLDHLSISHHDGSIFDDPNPGVYRSRPQNEAVCRLE